MSSHNSISSSNFSYFSSVPYAQPTTSKSKKQQSPKRQSQEQQQPNSEVQTLYNSNQGIIASTTDPNSSYFAFFDTPAFPTFPQGEETLYGDNDETPDHVAFSPRRSISPIGGAASAMKSFLRKRRGTLTNSTISNSDSQHQMRYSRTSDQFNIQAASPSVSAQSFIFVGGYGVEPGTTMIINDIDTTSYSPPSSPICSQAILPANLPTNLSTNHTNYSTVTTIPQQTFSQVMTSHLNNQEMGTIQIPISNNRNHSCDTSMTATPVLAPNPASSSFSSISSDSSSSPLTSMYFNTVYPTNQRDAEISNTHYPQAGKHQMFQNSHKDPSFETPTIQSNNDSIHSSGVLNDADNKQGRDRVHRKSDPPLRDNWSDRRMISKELTLAFNVSGFPDNVLEIGFGANQDKAEIQEPEDRETAASQQTRLKPQVDRQKDELLYNNSIHLLLEGSGFVPNCGNSFGRNISNNQFHNEIRHSRDSDLQSKNGNHTYVTDIQDTNVALQDLENEIQVLKSKEITLPVIDQVIKESSEELDVAPTTQQKQRRSDDDILLVSDSSSPTQFYDSDQTRYAIRTFLTGSDSEFDEMVEYGFPSEIFPESNVDNKNPKRTATASDPLTDMTCRYLTLRVTLTPWHARAHETKLYGSDSIVSNKAQLKTMVNKFFSRSPAVVPASVYTPPPSQRVRMNAGSRRPSVQSNTTSTSARSSSEQPNPTLTRTRRESGPAQPTLIRSSLDEDKEGNLSRSSSGSASQSPVGSRPSSRARDRRDSLRKDNKPIILDQSVDLSLQLQTPSIVRIPPPSPGIMATEAILPERGMNPSPSPHPLIISQHSQFQLPRKGSLTALSVPFKENQENLQPYSVTSTNNDSTMSPSIRKGATPAIFNPSGNTNTQSGQVTEKPRELNLAPSLPRPLAIEGRPPTPRRISSISYNSALSSTESLNQTLHNHQPPQDPKRSLRYPFQQHILYQEQIQQQQNKSRLSTSSIYRSPLTSVSSQQQHPLSNMSYAVTHDATEQIYNYYQSSPVEKHQPLEPEKTENRSATQPRLKLSGFSCDNMCEDSDKAALVEQLNPPIIKPPPGPAPPIPPRINAKSWKRRGSQQRQTNSGAPTEAAILAAAIAAASTIEDSDGLPYCVLEHRDTGLDTWNPDYTENRYSNNQSPYNGQSETNGYHHNHVKAAAVPSNGY